MPFSELAGDSACGPLLGPSPFLDQLDHPGRQARRTARWRAGTVLEPRFALGAVTGDPFRQGGSSDAELGSDVGDRAAAIDHLRDSSLPSKSGERGITVSHGTGLLPDDGCLDTTHRAGQGPVPSSPLRDYNVMTRNS